MTASAPIVAELGGLLPGWQLALWFTGRSAALYDHRPVDLFGDRPGDVVAAAKALATDLGRH